MCGIAAYSGSTPFDLPTMRTLMLSNLPRGLDATGIFSPLNKLIKEPVNGTAFLAKHLDTLQPDKTFIGHLRAKTYGENSEANAHPFEFNLLTGVHNGTLITPWSLTFRYNIDAKNLHVDSQALYAVINKQLTASDNDMTKLDVLSEFEGAAALVWYNHVDEYLYVYRNKERPLHYGTKDGNLYIASMEDSLKLIEATDIKQFTENTLYQLDKGVIKRSSYYSPYVKPVATLPVVTYGANKKTDTYTSIHNELKSVDYVGYWWISRWTAQPNITVDKAYLCVGTSPGYSPSNPISYHDILIINDKNERVSMNRFGFTTDLYEHMQQEDAYVVALIDLYNENIKTVDQGQVLQLLAKQVKRDEDGAPIFAVLNLRTRETRTVPANFLYPIDDEDLLNTLRHNDYYGNEELRVQYEKDIAEDTDSPSDVDFTVVAESVVPPVCELDNQDEVDELDEFYQTREGEYHEDRNKSTLLKVVTYKQVYDFVDEVDVQLREAADDIIETLNKVYLLDEEQLVKLTDIILESLMEVSSMLSNTMVDKRENIGDLEYGEINY